MSTASSDNQKAFTMTFSKDQHMQLKLRAVREDRPMVEIIRALVSDYLEKADGDEQ